MLQPEHERRALAVVKTAPSDAVLARAIESPAPALSALDQIAFEFSPSPAETARWTEYLHTYPCDLHSSAPPAIN